MRARLNLHNKLVVGFQLWFGDKSDLVGWPARIGIWRVAAPGYRRQARVTCSLTLAPNYTSLRQLRVVFPCPLDAPKRCSSSLSRRAGDALADESRNAGDAYRGKPRVCALCAKGKAQSLWKMELCRREHLMEPYRSARRLVLGTLGRGPAERLWGTFMRCLVSWLIVSAQSIPRTSSSFLTFCACVSHCCYCFAANSALRSLCFASMCAVGLRDKKNCASATYPGMVHYARQANKSSRLTTRGSRQLHN